MKTLFAGTLLALSLGFAACTTTPVANNDNPAAATMSFKSGARYQYSTYHTDPSTNTKQDSTASTDTWTLVNTSAQINGRSNVAVYVDSTFSAFSGLISVSDSTYLAQDAGTNDIWRWGALLPELNINTFGLVNIGKQWMHEARLNSTAAAWIVGNVADTFPNTFGIPAVTGFVLSGTDSVDGSSVENMSIGGQSYATTKTQHALVLKLTVLTQVLGQTIPVDLKSETMTRTTWTAPALGTIVREDRAGKLITASYGGQTFNIPIPGYYSIMTQVLATGG